MREFRVSAIIISALLCLALFWVGSSLYEAHAREEPLRELLAEHSGVRSFFLERADVWEVRVRMQPTDDLRAAYLELTGAIEEIVGPDRFALQVEDDSPAALAAWWEELSPYVYEGAGNATFGQMRDRIREAVAGEDVSAAVQVDEERIYLRLQGGGDELHRVITRTDGDRREPHE